MIPVAENRVVSLRYIMKNSKGEILENRMEGDPISYLQGSSGIQSLLQDQLEGLIRGDVKTIYLPIPSGSTNENFSFDVIIDDVSAASDEEILLGYPVQTRVEKCASNCDCYHTHSIEP